MKERPILFSGEMVRAILTGKKTMTRRVVKPQPDEEGLAKLIDGPWIDTAEKEYRCPYGHTGDRLWVRETWRIADSDLCGCGDSCCTCGCHGQPIYAASIENDLDYYSPWRPSIHMPRSASRITLEVTGIRVERLQQISEADVDAEGVTETDFYGAAEHASIGGVSLPHSIDKCAFVMLWDSINAKRPGYLWAENPWVWAIEFKRI